MRTRIAWLLLLIMVMVSLVGCGNQGQETGGAVEETQTPEMTATQTASPTEEIQESEEITAPITIDTTMKIQPGSHIAVIAKSTEGEYWETMRTYMEEAVSYINRQYGYQGDEQITMTFEGPKDETDVTTQINTFDAVLSENPDVICIAAIDMESCQAQLETAQDNGIPVISYDSGIHSDLVTTTCLTDNNKLGRKAAVRLGKAIDKAGKVAVFAHESYTQSAADRVEGFRKKMKEYDDVKIASVTYSNGDESLAEMVETVLESHKDLQGIFCTSAGVTEEVLDILGKYPQRDIKIIGVDMGSKQKKAIMDGIEYGAMVQDIYGMAYETIWNSVQTTAEEAKLSPETKIPFIWVNQTYLEQNEGNQNLYD